MNPLHWKREHQIALVMAIALGAAVGWFIGLREVSPYGHEYWTLWCQAPSAFYGSDCTFIEPGYWLLVVVWAAAGSTFSATIIVIRQLLHMGDSAELVPVAPAVPASGIKGSISPDRKSHLIILGLSTIFIIAVILAAFA